MLDIKMKPATPLARKLAAAHGVDLAALNGSGPGGRVMKADVLARIAGVGRADLIDLTPPPLPSSPPLLPSLSPALPLPIATATLEADVSATLVLLRAREPELARLRLRAGLLAALIGAVAALLPAHPLLNACWSEAGLVRRRRLHIAAAAPVAGGGLGWALVRDAGDLNLRGLARALARPADDLTAATFAVAGLPDGASWWSALPPLANTAAALSFGAPRAQAVAQEGGVAIRPLVALSVSYDARVLDHAQAARFLVELRDALERAA